MRAIRTPSHGSGGTLGPCDADTGSPHGSAARWGWRARDADIPRIGRHAGAMRDAHAIPRIWRGTLGAMRDADAIPRIGRNAGAMGDADAIPRIWRQAGAVSNADAVPRVWRYAGAMRAMRDTVHFD